MALSYMTYGEPKAYEKIATLTTAIGFTSTNLSLATAGYLPMRAALVTAEDGDVRFTQDGTTPVVTGATEEGHMLPKDQSVMIIGNEACRNFLAINAVNANGANLKCTYFY